MQSSGSFSQFFNFPEESTCNISMFSSCGRLRCYEGSVVVGERPLESVLCVVAKRSRIVFRCCSG